MGAIHLQTILNFECLANSYFFLIRKLKTDVGKTVIMIKIFRTWDCMPQEVVLPILSGGENQRFRGRARDWNPGGTTPWYSPARTGDKQVTHTASASARPFFLLLHLQFSKEPEKVLVAHPVNTCLPCDCVQRKSWLSMVLNTALPPTVLHTREIREIVVGTVFRESEYS